MPSVTLIEDDPSISRGLSLALGRHGHDVTACESGEEGLRQLQADGADIVVLDLMLPGIDGFEVCRRIRATGSVPIIMLTARDGDLDIVGGLEMGADDYVVKPVEPRVLDARIRAVLRRDRGGSVGVRTFGDLVVDPSSLRVTKDGVELALTPTEFRLLLELSGSPRQVFSREQLLRLVWEYDYLGDSRLVDNCVQRLRTKIEDRPASPRFVQTVRGFGYRFGPL